MSYAYRYPQQKNQAASKASSMGASNMDACQPPAHDEQVGVQHHVYTHHVQPVTRVWMTHDVQYREVPVTQETRMVNYPAQEICVSAPKACPKPQAQAAQPPAAHGACACKQASQGLYGRY